MAVVRVRYDGVGAGMTYIRRREGEGEREDYFS
jgi:hypothetical protein